MTRKAKPRIGRPPHRDDPAKLFSTTIPTSIYALLCEVAEVQRRPKSEVLADCIRAYARRIGVTT